MAWLSLILAGGFEMLGVTMMNKYSVDRKWHSLALLFLCFAGSFSLLSIAMESIPMGTAYAIWTGIGASGGAVVGMLFYGESRNWKRILFISLILSSAIGLKLVG